MPLHDALCDLVGAEPGLELAGSATDADEAIEKAEALKPDVAVLDVHMPAGGGQRAVREIGGVSPHTRAIALSAYDDRSHVLQMLRAGAIGYVVKGSPPEEILDAIHRAARGQSSFSIGIVTELVSDLASDVDRDAAERRRMLMHLVAAEEEERRRIAAAIHDDSIQVMTAAGMRLQILRRQLSDDKQLERLNELQATVQLAVARLRHLLFVLHPPALDTEGLSAALRMHLDEAAERSATQFRLVDRMGAQPPDSVRVALYRMARELLLNVEEHADAATATVTVSEADTGYLVSVTDDGVGFSPERRREPGEFGLESVRQRAELAGGWLRVDSEPGAGSTIDFWIPAARDGVPAGLGAT